MSRRILIHGGTVITVDPAIGDFAQGEVLVEDACIAQVAPRIDGVADAEEALQWSVTNSEHGWDCFVHCARGDALLASGDRAGAEADYQLALAWSRERNAKWGELCSGVRLGRLWRADGHSLEARDLLTPVYGWFTEGFDNPLMKEARTLLDELNEKQGAVSGGGIGAITPRMG